MAQFHRHFRHDTEAVDEGDFDNDAELQIITTLTMLTHNLVAWQAECLAVWKQLVEAAAEANRQHPARQTNVQQQYPDLFAYLAEGAAEGTEPVLMPWEMEYGKPDQKETIAAREVLLAERMMQQEGREDLDPDLEQYVATGGGTAPIDDMLESGSPVFI